MAEVFSVRLPAELLTALRDEADRRGVSISDLARDAIERLVGTPIGWKCEHFSMTSAPGVLTKVSGCSCEMKPIYPRRKERAA